MPKIIYNVGQGKGKKRPVLERGCLTIGLRRWGGLERRKLLGKNLI